MNRLTTIFLSLVMAVAVVGYFVGLGDGVPKPDGLYDSPLLDREISATAASDVKLIPAVSYAEIASTPMGPTKPWQATPQTLPGADYDLYTKIEPSEAEKEASSKLRASRLQRRAPDHPAPRREHNGCRLLCMPFQRREDGGLESQRDVAPVPGELRTVPRSDGTRTVSRR